MESNEASADPTREVDQMFYRVHRETAPRARVVAAMVQIVRTPVEEAPGVDPDWALALARERRVHKTMDEIEVDIRPEPSQHKQRRRA